ncbi:MAG: AbrB/MazE/SpoVT family DNA-binding domain-containing protein [Nanoarchaeota archaeon]
MECIDITSMSSRGQIVIPQRLREKLGFLEGEKFIVMGEEGTLILKRIEKPSKEDLIKKLDMITEKTRKKVEKSGIKESDISKIVHKTRGVRE